LHLCRNLKWLLTCLGAWDCCTSFGHRMVFRPSPVCQWLFKEVIYYPYGMTNMRICSESLPSLQLRFQVPTGQSLHGWTNRRYGLQQFLYWYERKNLEAVDIFSNSISLDLSNIFTTGPFSLELTVYLY
jgi:hypothetical protein